MEPPSTCNDDDIINDGKHIIIRRTFESTAFKLVKIGVDK